MLFIILRSSKENVIQALQILKQEVQASDKVPGLDGGLRKTVLLVTTTRPKDGLSIRMNIITLLEGGYVVFILFYLFNEVCFFMMYFVMYARLHDVERSKSLFLRD